MRPIHEHDCDFHFIGICTCGALNKCRRMAGGANVPGMAEHEGNIKKLRDLQSAPAQRVPNDSVPASGESANV
jgi:hypothetical protein